MSTTEAESPLDPDEPHTPVWFTFLGITLFLLGGIFLLASGDDEAEAAEAAAPAETDEQEAEPAAEEPEAKQPSVQGKAVPPGNVKARPSRPSRPARRVDPADPHAGHNH